MLEGIPRRKRRLLITAAFAAAFILVASVVVIGATRPDATYRPGEAIEGLTADLARSLPEDYPRVTFTDVTTEAGIDFTHFHGSRTAQLPEDYGSGVAWGDYDNDGWQDLFVVNDVGPVTMTSEEIAASPARSVLYHNNQDGTFTDVTAQSGIDFHGSGMGAAWGDYDNDGQLDLFVSAWGHNAFYRNNGDGTFTNITTEAGLDAGDGFWTAIAWGDFNRDGFLDLYVTAYVYYEYREATGAATLQYETEVPTAINPSSFQPARNLLYRNNADGTFSEVALEAGVRDTLGRSLAATWTDFDLDGWPDLYVANDVSDNTLYHNLGNGTFEEISRASLVADYRGAMGLALADWDHDLDMDMFVTHWIAQENALYSSLRTQLIKLNPQRSDVIRFMDEADRYGLGQIALSSIAFGTAFLDYDNDSRPDLYVVNGSTFQQDEDPRLLIGMRDQLFWNRSSDAGFYDVSLVSGEYFAREHVGRGGAVADYDNDGDMDVFVVNNGGPAILLRNDGNTGNNWIELQLEGTASNRLAIGAHLRLVTDSIVQIGELGTQGSYLSQHSVVQHFGLGPHSIVDTIEIRWPSGTGQIVTHVPANRLLRIIEQGGDR
ncbi:MAG: CRTAC1 family protein [Gemmatimonadota bacterium]|nr:MAG: CRTAC1 family protein [Gemmatimonadota bacterium]